MKVQKRPCRLCHSLLKDHITDDPNAVGYPICTNEDFDDGPAEAWNSFEPMTDNLEYMAWRYERKIK